jgi:hypothetical protein
VKTYQHGHYQGKREAEIKQIILFVGISLPKAQSYNVGQYG